MNKPLSAIAETDLRSLLDTWQNNTMLRLNCHRIGTILEFDPVRQVARVQIAALAVFGSETVPYPVLTDCPVFVPCGAGACLTMPVLTDDPCLVLFNDRDMDNWFVSGAVAAPNTPRTHDLSDGLVIVGFRHAANPIPNYSAEDPELRNGPGTIGIGNDGLVSIRNDITTLKNVMTTLITALNKLNTKTGPDASVQINDVNDLIYALLK